MNLEDLTPAGGGSLRALVASPACEPVATFTRPVVQHPDETWNPRGSEIAPPQRPLTPAPAHGFEHEPVNRAERAAQHTAQNASDFHAAATSIRGRCDSAAWPRQPQRASESHAGRPRRRVGYGRSSAWPASAPDTWIPGWDTGPGGSFPAPALPSVWKPVSAVVLPGPAIVGTAPP